MGMMGKVGRWDDEKMGTTGRLGRQKKNLIVPKSHCLVVFFDSGTMG